MTAQPKLVGMSSRKADFGEQFGWRRERAAAGVLWVKEAKEGGRRRAESPFLFVGAAPARFEARYDAATSVEENTLNLLDDVWDVVAEDDGFAAASALRMKQVGAAVTARQQFEEANPELDEAGKLARLTKLRGCLDQCQDRNPPSTSQSYWGKVCTGNNVEFTYPKGAKKKWKDGNGARVPQSFTYQTLAASSTECCIMEMMDLDAPGDAEDTSVPVVHYTAKAIADKRKKDLARAEFVAVAFCAELSAAPDLLVQFRRHRRHWRRIC